jgi:hypothetical protein
MSIETFSPLPLNVFGSWITLLDPSDVPPGMSPNLADVDFFPGGVRTRPGLVSQMSGIGGTPQINGLKTYINTNLQPFLLVLDSLGNLYEEISPGVLSLLAAGVVKPSLYLASTTHFGREYMALGDGLIGQDLPRQFDGTNFDRVSQVGPGEGPSVVDSTTAESISPGVHQVAVVFVTRQGYWTAPSVPASWTAAGNLKVNVTNIPTGPANVVQRLLAFTASGGASFYHVPAAMVINDNTTTSLTVDFTDTILLSGTSMDYLFGQVELPPQLGSAAYAERIFWWGERAAMDSWRNLSFDGGWDASGNGRPLGWQLDPTFGAGGSRESSDVIWGDAYRITANGTTASRGMIEQYATVDAAGNPLCVNNTDYSVRAHQAQRESHGGHAANRRLQSHGRSGGRRHERQRDAGHHGLSRVHRRTFPSAGIAAARFVAPRLRGWISGAFGRVVPDRLHRDFSHECVAESFARARLRHGPARSIRRRDRHHEYRRKQRPGPARRFHAAKQSLLREGAQPVRDGHGRRQRTGALASGGSVESGRHSFSARRGHWRGMGRNRGPHGTVFFRRRRAGEALAGNSAHLGRD